MSLFDANHEGHVHTCGNILFQPKTALPLEPSEKDPYTSSVMPKSLGAPVAPATPLSLLCISCVLHAQVHPQRSARVARFARSLAARQQSNSRTSLYVFLHLLEHLRGVWGCRRPFGIVLGSSSAVLEQTWRVLECLRHLFTHVNHILSHLKAILARSPPPRTPSKWNFLNVQNTHFS